MVVYGGFLVCGVVIVGGGCFKIVLGFCVCVVFVLGCCCGGVVCLLFGVMLDIFFIVLFVDDEFELCVLLVEYFGCNGFDVM